MEKKPPSSNLIYNARSLAGNFQMELLGDVVKVTGNYALGNGKVQAEIPLKSLQPRIVRVWIRSRYFHTGLSFFTVEFGTFAICIQQFKMAFYEPLPVFAFGIGVVGLFLCCVTFHPKEFARFISVGGVVALNVVRTGDKDQFENFVAAVLAAISKANDPAAAPLSDSSGSSPSLPSPDASIES